MPFGFPAYAEKSVRYRGATRKELIRAADDALAELGWQPYPDGKSRLRASVPIGFYIIFLTWGARFLVEVEDERVHLRSEGSLPIEWLDIGQHDHNINRFLDRFEEILDEQDGAR